MFKLNITRVLEVALTLILTAMTLQVKSQNLPVSDQIGTAEGNVELYLSGMDRLCSKWIIKLVYVDPVKSSGNYINMPDADIILITHEHYDHLDTDLIADLKTPGTVILCNGAAAAKVKGRAMKGGELRKDWQDFY